MARFVSKYLSFTLHQSLAYKKEVNGQIMRVPGKRFDFRNGGFVTENEEDIKFLREAAKKSKDFWEIDEKKMEKAREFAKKVDVLKKEMDLDDDTIKESKKKPKKAAVRGTVSSDKGLNTEKIASQEEESDVD